MTGQRPILRRAFNIPALHSVLCSYFLLLTSYFFDRGSTDFEVIDESHRVVENGGSHDRGSSDCFDGLK